MKTALIVIFIVILILLVGCPIYSCILAKGKLRIVFIIGNLILITALASINIYSKSDAEEVKQLSYEHTIIGDGLLFSLLYDRTEDGYYIIEYSQIMGQGDIAVPVKNFELPANITSGSHILAICDKSDDDTPWYGSSNITLNGRYYHLADNIIGVRRRNSGRIFSAMLDCFIISLLFNTVGAVIVTVQRHRRRKAAREKEKANEPGA